MRLVNSSGMRLEQRILALGVAVLACGCSHTGGSPEAARPRPAATVALANATGFPLPAGTRLLAARSFSQTVSAAAAGKSELTADSAGTYAGHEVIAASSNSFGALSRWLQSQKAKPPAGFRYQAVAGAKVADFQKVIERDGIDYAVFRAEGNAKGRSVLVIAMDPLAAKRKLGFALDMAARYRALPAVMRSGIDDQVKSRTGFSLEEALAPESPIGVALSVIAQFEQKDERALILVDAKRE